MLGTGNTLINPQLYKKAYLIEFYKDNAIKPKEVFTFSVPPESEELTYSQRKSEVKTFGGLHIDDYGIDAVRVMLSGSTVNQSIKRIYKGGLGKDDWLSGEDEIYHFRDLIQKYKSLDFLTNNKNAKIMVYDLSKFTGLRLDTIDNYWQAFNGDFKIRRSSDRPFTYKYTFEFTGVSPTESCKTALPLGSKALAALVAVLGVLKSALNFMNNVQALIDDVLGYADQVSGLMKEMEQLMTYVSGTIPGIMTKVGIATAGIVDGTNSLVAMPHTIQLSALNIGLEMQNAANRLMKSTEALCKTCRGYTNDESWKPPQEVLDMYAANGEEFNDTINIMLDKSENSANEMMAWVKSGGIPDFTEGNPDPVTGDPHVVMSYGSTPIMLKDTDSFESIATEYLGDPDRAIDIATYNNVASLSDLRPGDTIKIPITTRTVRITNNLIFARREDRDNYGRDIMLTDDGFIVVSNAGDYQVTSGVQNLSQAILLRLRESKTKRIRINAYGIRNNISDPTAGKAYIISSIKLTVSNDPRVASVDKINFKGEGDTLDIVVFYRDINNTNGKTAGRI